VDCGEATENTEHAFFQCESWWKLRRELEVIIGRSLDPDTIVQVMLKSEEKWEAVRKFADAVISKREEEKRIRQRERI